MLFLDFKYFLCSAIYNKEKNARIFAQEIHESFTEVKEQIVILQFIIGNLSNNFLLGKYIRYTLTNYTKTTIICIEQKQQLYLKMSKYHPNYGCSNERYFSFLTIVETYKKLSNNEKIYIFVDEKEI